jgi:hypothetical protein
MFWAREVGLDDARDLLEQEGLGVVTKEGQQDFR